MQFAPLPRQSITDKPTLWHFPIHRDIGGLSPDQAALPDVAFWNPHVLQNVEAKQAGALNQLLTLLNLEAAHRSWFELRKLGEELWRESLKKLLWVATLLIE